MTSQDKPVKIAVVTGGHAYDVPHFHELFRAFEGIDAYIQSMDDFAASPEEVRDSYDVVLFYTMLREGPTDEGLPWYAGHPKQALEHLVKTDQGILILHHALLAYPTWPVWDQIVGIEDRVNFGYAMGETLHIYVNQPEHPITQGMADWEMIDETYQMPEPQADATSPNDILLTTDHEKSMEPIAWTRSYPPEEQAPDTRIFCLQSGHDHDTWSHENFRKILRRGILWCADRI